MYYRGKQKTTPGCEVEIFLKCVFWGRFTSAETQCASTVSTYILVCWRPNQIILPNGSFQLYRIINLCNTSIAMSTPSQTLASYQQQKKKKRLKNLFAMNTTQFDSFCCVMMRYLNPNSQSMKELFAEHGRIPLVLGRKKSPYACKATYVTCFEIADISQVIDFTSIASFQCVSGSGSCILWLSSWKYLCKSNYSFNQK